MSRCIHVYSFVARNHGGIPFSGVCPFKNPARSTDFFKWAPIFKRGRNPALVVMPSVFVAIIINICRSGTNL